MLDWFEYQEIRKKYFKEKKSEALKSYNNYKTIMEKRLNMNNCIDVVCGTTYTTAYIDYPKQSVWPAPNSLAPIEVCPAPTPKPWPGNQEKGNNPMNYATATVQAGTTETQDQRKYLSNRLEDIYYTLLRPLEAEFGLIDDERPRTPKELKQRIADGKFVIKGIKDADEEDDDEDDYFYGGWTNMIRWRDPAKKADHDGYQAAIKELQDLRQKTMDVIKIDEPKAGLDAIKALEDWKPTGAAN